VQINRTEALDASRAAVRERKVVLPRQSQIIEESPGTWLRMPRFWRKTRDRGEKYKYIRTGADHFSLAFTYAWMAAAVDAGMRAWFMA